MSLLDELYPESWQEDPWTVQESILPILPLESLGGALDRRTSPYNTISLDFDLLDGGRSFLAQATEFSVHPSPDFVDDRMDCHQDEFKDREGLVLNDRDERFIRRILSSSGELFSSEVEKESSVEILFESGESFAIPVILPHPPLSSRLLATEDLPEKLSIEIKKEEEHEENGMIGTEAKPIDDESVLEPQEFQELLRPKGKRTPRRVPHRHFLPEHDSIILAQVALFKARNPRIH